MRKLMIAVLIPFLFYGFVSAADEWKVAINSVSPLVVASTSPLVVVSTSPLAIMVSSPVMPPEFKNDLVSVSYLQRSTTTANVIAVVSISGEINDEDESNMVGDLKTMFRIAREDRRVKAVILKVQSPGGSVNASDLIWNEVMKFKKSGKPVVAFFNGLAASGGYYVSVPADKIIATPETWTGSIGVISWAEDDSVKLKKAGVKVTAIKSGARKDMLSPYKPTQDEDLAIIQAMVDSAYGRFVQKVAQGRHMDESVVRILADGRIYDAQQALGNGLIDEIGYIEDSFNVAKALAYTSDVSFIELKSKANPAAMLMQLLSGDASTGAASQPSLSRKSARSYYLWTVGN